MEVGLSYILPAYNVGQYIGRCLSSLMAQGLHVEEYEIIIINDGSTDHTLQEIAIFENHHPDVNITVVNKPNEGQSAARNDGIAIAKGGYIWFIDSDDYLMPHVAKKLLQEAVTDDLDMLWFDHQLVSLTEQLLPKPKEDIKTGIHEDIVKGPAFLTGNFRNSCMPCMFLIKKDMFQKNHILFIKGIYFEDIVFTIQMIFLSERIRFTNILAYNYRMNPDSTMRSPSRQKKRILDSLMVVQALNKFSDEQKDPALDLYIDSFTGAILLYNYRLSISLNEPDFLAEFKARMKEYGLYPFQIQVPLQRKWLAKVANFSPFVFEKLARLRPVN